MGAVDRPQEKLCWAELDRSFLEMTSGSKSTASTGPVGGRGLEGLEDRFDIEATPSPQGVIHLVFTRRARP